MAEQKSYVLTQGQMGELRALIDGMTCRNEAEAISELLSSLPPAPEWCTDMSLVQTSDDLVLWRRDCGWFSGFYGSMENFGWPDTKVEKFMEEHGEGAFFADDWWAYTQDGAVRLEGDEVPTAWMIPSLPKETTDEQ